MTKAIQKRAVDQVFLGPHGLRAGWSCLLFAVVFAVAYLLLGWLLQSVFLAATHGTGHLSSMTLSFGLVYEGFLLSCVIAATACMAMLEDRPVLSYGYEGRFRALRLFCGFGWGLIAICAFIFLLSKLHLLRLGGQVLHGGAIWKYGLGWAIVFLLVALFEDSTVRGYLQFTLARGIGFWWSALLTSFVFGFSHFGNTGESAIGLLSAGGIGLIFCLSLWYTGSLWWAVGFHAAWDWGQSFLFGTSDSGVVAQGHLLAERPLGSPLWSGGVTGPEGSVLVFPLLALIAICMKLWWGRSKQPAPLCRGCAWKPLAAHREMPIER